MLGMVFFIGTEIYGARNWIVIGGFAFQPSEFVKIIFVFFVAALLAGRTDFIWIIKVGIVAAVHVLILVAEKDLGAALIYFMTFLIIVYVASEKELYLFTGLGAGAVAAFVAYKVFTHVQVRVEAWRDPWSIIDGRGYQITQSLFAIGTGGWFGLGLGEGAPDTVPVVQSDFIFSAIAEELGVFFALCLILIYISCFIMFINIALKMKKQFYKLTAIGLSVVFIFQVFLTIGGVTKFIPSTGVTLPLISYGGSSVISTVILFSVIQGMYELNVNEERSIERRSEKSRKQKKGKDAGGNRGNKKSRKR